MKFVRTSVAVFVSAVLAFSAEAVFASANFSYLTQTEKNALTGTYEEILPASTGFIVKQNGSYGLLDDSGTLLLKPEWASVTPGEDMVLLLDHAGKYGFADWTGNVCIPPAYDYAAPFSDGIAKVKKNGKFSYIDQSGEHLIPWQSHEIQSADGMYFTYRENGKSTVMDNQGTVVIQPYYENMLLFRDGAAAAMSPDGWYGLIAIDGNEILPFAYRELRYIGKGLYLALKDNKQGYFNVKGQPVGSMIWEPSAVTPIIGNLLAAEGAGKIGFMDLQGNMIQELRFESVLPSADGTGPIFVKRDGKYGLLDNNGKQLLEPTLILDENGAYAFEDGFATICKNGYQGILDAKGNLVVRPEYQTARVTGNFLYLQDDSTASVARLNTVLQPLDTDILTAPVTAGKLQFITAAGILQGTETGDLMLDTTVTRAQFVTMLARAEQWDLSVPADMNFSDVPGDHWANAAISHAAACGIVNGMGDGTFQPDSPVTTLQIFTILVRLAGKEADAQTIASAGGNGYADTAWQMGIGSTEIGWALPAPASRELTACFLYDYLQWKNNR